MQVCEAIERFGIAGYENHKENVEIYPITSHWFNEIASGRKPEEYRDYKDFYKKRFEKYAGKDRFAIGFRAGYRPHSPLMVCLVSLYVGRGNPNWGAVPGKLYFVLKIEKCEVIRK